MLYAVVDIETTGSHASEHGITEIGIVVTDGRQVVEVYETLVNPEQPIPPFIQVLTGINNEMVAVAPRFEEVAPRVFELLQDKVFVAHNVNFDYSFVQHHLRHAGYGLNTRKLCTVRLSRKVFPGLAGYSLGKLTRQLGVSMERHHRAGADAKATAEVLHRILGEDRDGHVDSMLKSKYHQQQLPPNLSEALVQNLPTSPGVYYFHDIHGKVVYVGKANNLKKRVLGHFTGNDAGMKRQSFLNHIHEVTYQVCGSELMAFILEHSEIRRLWPLFNYAHKHPVEAFSLYVFEDVKGYLRLAIEGKKKHLEPVYTFNLLVEGQNMLRKLIQQFDLCPKMCFMDRTQGASLPEERGETMVAYNQRVMEAVAFLRKNLPTFAIVERSEASPDAACILMESGRFYGMGYLPQGTPVPQVEELKNMLTPYPDHDYIRGLIYRYIQRWPGKKVELTVA
ncbi:MAG TPA: exonuclease domain-containing protein [Dinghuibacter sp.]|uniref:exonuclease domain-containing protein n=1 Tax=Dinghuibacter sp. TaxID=2024697 RepID=UPI002D1679BD|nr:exonuclease domain-containing protein [Dinghuibacter sp.]HTJ12133.1 exonuclease domain-containing protein [Dinghuibacter sp.]